MPVVACSNCGKERKIDQYKTRRKGYTGLCYPCLIISRTGDKNWNWRGGFCITLAGYKKILVYKDNFFHSMADTNGYVMEHRLVMAKHLGRNLHSWELVHHRGSKHPKGSKEDKQDNRI